MTQTGKRSKKPQREPTAGELAQIEAARETLAERPPRVEFSVKTAGRGVVKVSGAHTDQKGWHDALVVAMGTTSPDFAHFTLASAIEVVAGRAGTKEAANRMRYNATVALIEGIAPQNELEATIATQLAATNSLAMDSMKRAMNADDMQRREAFINQATKLSRTFTAQVEALSKLRTGGKQTHEVVYIDARNGQNVFNPNFAPGGGRGAGAIAGQCHAPALLSGAAAAPGLSMWGTDPARNAMPVASGAGPQALPDARGDEPRCAERKG